MCVGERGVQGQDKDVRWTDINQQTETWYNFKSRDRRLCVRSVCVCVCVYVCVCGVCEGHMAEIFEPWASAKVVLASAFHDGCNKSEHLK